MNNQISLTIPRIACDLRCAAHYLNTLAEGLDSKTEVEPGGGVLIKPGAKAEMMPGGTLVITNPGEVEEININLDFISEESPPTPASAPVAPPAPAPAASDASAAFGGGETGDPAASPAAPAPAPAAPAPTPEGQSTVETDADGLPWDERIHGSGRKKLAKTQQWKLKRKPKEMSETEWLAEVERVKTELKAVMAIPAVAPAPAPAAPAPVEPQAPAPAAPPAPAPQAPAPAAPPAPANDYSTWGWPEFMGEFMRRGMEQSQALAACQKHGIDSTAVLASRPDLIPQVAATLFEG